MTKEQIFEKIDDVYSDHDGGVIYLSEDRMNQIKEVIQQAINFIPCCTGLKGFEQWKKTVNLNTDSYPENALIEMYKDTL